METIFHSSLLGSPPACFGSFAGVSLYIHGMISFGAITGLMLATAGDEQFIMLAMIPETALILFAILFLLGIIAGYLTDFLIKKINIITYGLRNQTISFGRKRLQTLF